jgi:hypothetical protein
VSERLVALWSLEQERSEPTTPAAHPLLGEGFFTIVDHQVDEHSAQSPGEYSVGHDLIAHDHDLIGPPDPEPSPRGPWLVTPAHHAGNSSLGAVGEGNGTVNAGMALEVINRRVDRTLELIRWGTLAGDGAVDIEDQRYLIPDVVQQYLYIAQLARSVPNDAMPHRYSLLGVRIAAVARECGS